MVHMRKFVLQVEPVLGVGGRSEYLTVLVAQISMKNLFWQSFAIYIADVYRSLASEWFPIYYCTKSAQVLSCCYAPSEFLCPCIGWPAGCVACQRTANNMPADKISHFSTIAQMATLIVVQVEFLRHAHTRGRTLDRLPPLKVLIDLFSLGVTGEVLWANITWKLAFSPQQG